MSFCADDVSISGFKDTISEQSTTESATEAVVNQKQEGGISPDTVSATSQSIDEPTTDIVRSPKSFRSQKYFSDIDKKYLEDSEKLF